MFHHIDETGFDYHVFDARLHVQLLTRFRTACNRQFSSLIESVPFDLGAVIGFGDRIDFAVLKVAAGFELATGMKPIS